MKSMKTALCFIVVATVAFSACNTKNARANENKDNYNHSTDSTGAAPGYANDSTRK